MKLSLEGSRPRSRRWAIAGAALAGLGLFGVSSGAQQEQEAGYAVEPQATPAPYQLILKEQFLVEGDEPYFWTVGIASDLRHATERDRSVVFDVEITRLDAVIGSLEPLEARMTHGVPRIELRRDSTGRRVTLPGEAPIASYLNGLMRTLAQRPRSGSWTETIRVFDESLVPALRKTEVNAHIEVARVTMGREVGSLMEYRTDPVTFRTNGSTVAATYRGFALIDGARQLVYHSVFEQTGRVRGNGKESTFKHVNAVYLADDGDEPIVPVDSSRALRDVAERFDYRGRPDTRNLNPDIEEDQERPPWATDTWYGGRLANMSIGAVAERGVNPVPLICVGSIFQTDAAIGFAGNVYKDHADILAGRKDEVDGYDPGDNEYRSPLQRAYAKAPVGTRRAREEERVQMLPAGAGGAVRIGTAVVGIGIPYAAAAGAFQGSSSAIAAGMATQAGVTSYTAAATSVAASAAAGAGAGIGAGAIAAGAAAVGAGVAVTNEALGGNGDPPPPFPFAGSLQGEWNGTCPGEGDIFGTFQLRISADGTISGSFDAGTVYNNVVITGQFVGEGNARGTGPDIDWTGSFTVSGTTLSGTGSWDCGATGCSGSWSGQGTTAGGSGGSG